MKVIANEIKKILNPINVITLVLISIIIWFLFIYFEIESFPKGFPASGSTDLSIEMLNKYGTTVDKEEFEDFKNTRKEREKVADEYIQSFEELTSRGINTYEEFRGVNSQIEGNSELYELTSDIFFKDDYNNEQILWELEGRDYLIEIYEESDIYLKPENIDNKKVLDRYNEVLIANASPLYFRILENYDDLIWWINILIIISIVFIISPIFLKDNKNSIVYLQYSSKTGRLLFSKKIIAGMISTLIITTIQLLVMFILYNKNNTYMFWDCSISSAFSHTLSWFDITFGQYIILSVILTYIIAIMMSTISMIISSRIGSYVSLIGMQIPVAFAIGYLLERVGIKRLTSVFYPKYLLHISYTGIIMICMILIYRSIRREKVKEL